MTRIDPPDFAYRCHGEAFSITPLTPVAARWLFINIRDGAIYPNDAIVCGMQFLGPVRAAIENAELTVGPPQHFFN